MWFGWGGRFRKRRWSRRWGICPKCGEVDFQASYDFTRALVIFGAPFPPYQNRRMERECWTCGQGMESSLRAWRRGRKERLMPALQERRRSPKDRVAARDALAALSELGERADYLPVAEEIGSVFRHDAEIQAQLAWMAGSFGMPHEAINLYERSLALKSSAEVAERLQAYREAPMGDPPKRPRAWKEWIRFWIGPFLASVVLGIAALFWFGARWERLYVVNGLSQPYEIVLNGQSIRLEPYVPRRITTSFGPVHVRCALGGVPTEETIPSPAPRWRIWQAQPTLVVNPDRAAALLWEEVVYLEESKKATSEQDHREYQVGQSHYFFEGIDDHFHDPPERVKLKSKSDESFRRVLRLGQLGSPKETASALGDEWAATYVASLLRHEPEHEDLAPFLMNSPDPAATAEELRPLLALRPIRQTWHVAYQELIRRGGDDDALEKEYEALLASAPNDPIAFYLFGRVQADPQAARQTLSRAAQAPNGPPHALVALAQLDAWAGDFNVGLERVQGALARLPKEESFVSAELDLLLASGRWEVLRERFEALLQANPADSSSALALAGLHSAMGKAEAASEVERRFLAALASGEKKPDDSEIKDIQTSFLFVKAQWAGDKESLLKTASIAGVPEAELEALLLQGKIGEAAKLADEKRPVTADPWLFYFLAGAGGDPALAEKLLARALADEEFGPDMAGLLRSWFGENARPPGLEDLPRLALLNERRRVLIAALGTRHPAERVAYWALARKLNYARVFPFLVLKQALGDS